MLNRTCQLLLVACLVTGTLWAANDPFVGKWKVNPSKSKLTDQMKVEVAGAKQIRGYEPAGSTLSLHYVYARTAGSSGFPGTWDSVSEEVNSVIELYIQPYKGDGLSFNSPAAQM